MVDALLDTATVVDLLRDYPPAAQWIRMQNQYLGITKFVMMEVVEGCQDKSALARAFRLIKRFQLVDISIQDVDWALDKLTLFNLSHNIDSFDCLIASTPYRLQIPLYTRNLKHFTPLLGSLAQKPY